MSEEKLKEIHKYKLELFDKLPYEITKNIPPRLLANMSIKELEQLNPSYKPPKEERKPTPQEQDLLDIEALKNPKFKFDMEDPKFTKLSPAVKTIYKDRFENLVKGLDKELIAEPIKVTTGKMSMKEIPVPETIRYNPTPIVPIMSRKDIDTVDQAEKIRELRKEQEKLTQETIKKDLEIQTQERRINALKKELVKEKYDIG